MAKVVSIPADREVLVETIEQSAVTIVTGPTGCGKSTQIPKYILESRLKKGVPVNIVVTQPRRIAAQTVARRVCHEMGLEACGGLVGYKVGLDKEHCSRDTRLVFCTTAILKNMIINEKSLMRWSHVILDEIHQREEDMDLVFFLCKLFGNTNSRCVRLVLMSATINMEKVEKYFSIPSVMMNLPPARIQISTRSPFHIEMLYLSACEGLLAKLGTSSDSIEAEHVKGPFLVHSLIHLIVMYLQEEEQRSECSVRGDVLVFLPGESEIEVAKRLIDAYGHRNWVTLALYSRQSQTDTDLVFKSFDQQRKIILATNIAETSITIEKIGVVFDFCLTKLLICDPSTCYVSLKLSWADRKSLIQRRGRTGRTMPGVVIRLITKSFEEGFIIEEHAPEILRVPLNKLVLDTKLLDMGSPVDVLKQTMDPPNLGNIVRTVMNLKEMGALLCTVNGAMCRDDGDLTFLGRVVASLPVDVPLGRMIVLGYLLGMLDEAIILAACLSNKSIFATCVGQKTRAYYQKLEFANESWSDLLATLNAFKECKQLESSASAPLNVRQSHYRKHFLQIKAVKEVDIKAAEIRDCLKEFNMINQGPAKGLAMREQQLLLQILFFGSFYPNYFVHQRTCGRMEEEEEKLLGRSARNSFYLSGFPMEQDSFSRIYIKDIKKMFSNLWPAEELEVEVFGSNVAVQVKHQPADTLFSRKMHVAMKMAVAEPSETKLLLYPYAQAKKLFQDLVSKQSGSLPKGTFLTMVLKSIEHPNSIWAVKDDGETEELAGKIQALVKMAVAAHHAAVAAERPDCPVSPGSLCLAPWSETYHRALLLGREAEGAYSIRLIDTAHTLLLPAGSALIPIDEAKFSDLLTTPGLALKLSMYGLEPRHASGWEAGATQILESALCSGCGSESVMVQVVASFPDEVWVNIFRRPPGHMTLWTLDGPVNKKLLAREDFKAFCGSALEQQRLLRQKEQLHEGMLDNYVEQILASVPADELACRTRLLLQGPASPLQYNLTSVHQLNGHLRVHISNDSVNSVLLDEPGTVDDCSFDQYFVAFRVDASNHGGSLVLRETSRMPNRPGLGSLLLMMFSPDVDLRTNFVGQYTGCLAGLGPCSASSRKGFHSDHDMEIQFDTVVQPEDIALINEFRRCMNDSLNPPNATLLDHSELAMIQDNLMGILEKLLSRPRVAMSRQPFEHPFSWNRLPAQTERLANAIFRPIRL